MRVAPGYTVVIGIIGAGNARLRISDAMWKELKAEPCYTGNTVGNTVVSTVHALSIMTHLVINPSYVRAAPIVKLVRTLSVGPGGHRS